MFLDVAGRLVNKDLHALLCPPFKSQLILLVHLSSYFTCSPKMRSSTTLAASVLFALPCAHAWGVVGHATVAAIANNYLTSTAKTYVASILGKGVTMESVASWADDYRYTTAGKFSAPYQ